MYLCSMWQYAEGEIIDPLYTIGAAGKSVNVCLNEVITRPWNKTTAGK